MTVQLSLRGEAIEVRFPYDPELVARIKGVPRWRWDPDVRAWYVPQLQLSALRRLFQ